MFVSRLQQRIRENRERAKAKALASRARVNNESDALSQALTFATGPIIFGLIGRWVDSAAGTGPLFLLVGIALGVVGGSATLYYRYQARMAELDANKPWLHSSTEDVVHTPRVADTYPTFPTAADLSAADASSVAK